MTEHVLNYDHSITPQERYWDCGPASTQVVLSGRGIGESETNLINRIGTTVNGTDDISWITPVLKQYLPDAAYAFAYIRNDPPRQADYDALWHAITNSIDAGYGMVANIVAPPSNYPRGVKGSASPAYGGGTVFHYIALMGYDDDSINQAVWVADPGFQPFGYWVSFAQLAGLITPKGYTYATTQVAAPGASETGPVDIVNMEGAPVDEATWMYWVDLRAKLIHEQLGGSPAFTGWPQLGGRTVTDAVAEILKKVSGS